MILQRITTYLNNQSYNINLSNNTIYINNYEKIEEINDNNLLINFEKFTLKIFGKDFKVSKMINKEILFNGTIERIEYNYK